MWANAAGRLARKRLATARPSRFAARIAPFLLARRFAPMSLGPPPGRALPIVSSRRRNAAYIANRACLLMGASVFFLQQSMLRAPPWRGTILREPRPRHSAAPRRSAVRDWPVA